MYAYIYLGSVALSLITYLAVDITLSEPLKKKNQKCKHKKQLRNEISLLVVSIILPITNLCAAGVLVNELVNVNKKKNQEKDLLQVGNKSKTKIKQQKTKNVTNREKLNFLKLEKNKLVNKTGDESSKKYYKKRNKSIQMLILLGIFIYLNKNN